MTDIGADIRRILRDISDFIGNQLPETIMISGSFLLLMIGAYVVNKNTGLRLVGLRNALIFLPVLLMLFWVALYPRFFLVPMHAAIRHLLEQVGITHD